MQYQKSTFSIEVQIAKLQTRGLYFENKLVAQMLDARC